MATNDTDPQRTQAFGDDPSRTEPAAPPMASVASDGEGASDAASLLAGLAESSQPIQDVAETEGHVAAAYAAAPHRPPRPNDKTVENPAVYINATVPLEPPPSSSRQKLGPPAAPFVSMNGAPTVPGGARLLEDLQRNETTEPGERTKNQIRLYLACIAGIVVAGLIAISILVFVQRANAVSSTTAASPSVAPSPSVIAPSVVDTADPSLAPTPSTPSPSISAPSSGITSPSPTSPTVTTKPTAPVRPRASSPSPRPSGTFAEPDRHL